MHKEFLNKVVSQYILLIAISSLAVFSHALPINKEQKLDIVVIDAGHGGKDAGAMVQGVREKDIVLNIALKLGNYIKKNYPEIKVIYTRDKDVFVPLHKRAEIANKNKAGLFISIHANYVGTSSVSGTETFVLGNHRSEDNLEVAKKENSVILLEDNYTTKYEGFDPNSSESYIMFSTIQGDYLEQSLEFAAEVQDQFRERAKRKDRGVKMAGFLVLRQTTMPSVLVEVGFISNKYERGYLVSESGKTYLASAIYRSFKQYKERVEARSNFNLNVTEVEIPEEEPEENQPIAENLNETVVNSNIWFTVQIAASQKSIALKPANFKKEKNVHKKQSGKLYKYYSGKFNNYQRVVEEKKRINKKFPDAFIVAFENDKQISVKKALRKSN